MLNNGVTLIEKIQEVKILLSFFLRKNGLKSNIGGITAKVRGYGRSYVHRDLPIVHFV